MDSLAFTKSPGERVEERHVPCIVDWRFLFVGTFGALSFVSIGLLLLIKEELALEGPRNAKMVHITCFLMTFTFCSLAKGKMFCHSFDL